MGSKKMTNYDYFKTNKEEHANDVCKKKENKI